MLVLVLLEPELQQGELPWAPLPPAAQPVHGLVWEIRLASLLLVCGRPSGYTYLLLLCRRRRQPAGGPLSDCTELVEC